MTGFIVVDKEQGVSSAREVAVIKRLTGQKCGHMGTLDPMATGVLPIAVGNAARLFDYLLNKKKTYIAGFAFGEYFDTLDITGTVKLSGGRVPTKEEIIGVIPKMQGEIMQIPPEYSAKNIGGKRAYRLAREGEQFFLPPKRVTVYSINLLGFEQPNVYMFKIECSGGTYIRSIARDMAETLGTYAAMSSLIRTASGPFIIENAHKTRDLTAENIENYIIPCDSVVDFTPLTLGAKEEKKLLNGIPVKTELSDGLYRLYLNDKTFYGLAQSEKGILKVRTKLC